MKVKFRFCWRGTILLFIIYTCAALYAADTAHQLFSPFRFHIH